MNSNGQAQLFDAADVECNHPSCIHVAVDGSDETWPVCTTCSRATTFTTVPPQPGVEVVVADRRPALRVAS
jgi:hypothetical protein